MMDKSPNYDVVIIGGGLAGVTAARELSNRGNRAPMKYRATFLRSALA